MSAGTSIIGAALATDRVVVTAGTVEVKGALNTGLMEVAGTLRVNPFRMDLGTLKVGPAGMVNVGSDYAMKDGSAYVCELGAASDSPLVVGGGVTLDPGSALMLEAVDSLGDLTTGGWGDKARTIIRTTGTEHIEGTFTDRPEPGEPLGHGAFYQGIAYEDHTVDVDLFQAATGDVDGNREVNFDDLWTIFATGGKYDTGEPASWIEGDVDGDDRIGFGDLWATFVTSGLYGTGFYADPPDTKGIAVPEPGTLGLLAPGLLALLLWRRRRAG